MSGSRSGYPNEFHAVSCRCSYGCRAVAYRLNRIVVESEVIALFLKYFLYIRWKVPNIAVPKTGYTS